MSTATLEKPAGKKRASRAEKFDAIATMREKGQVTIPARVREELGLKPGDPVLFEKTADGFTISRTMTLDERTDYMMEHMKPGVPPLTDASAFYQTREPRL